VSAQRREPRSDVTTVLEGPDEVALAELRGRLYGYCYRMLGGVADAEDAVQDALLRAWQRRDQFDASRGSLRQWAFGIAHHICIDRLRTARRRRMAMDISTPAHPGEDIGQPEPAERWVEPTADPADEAARRETVRLAFVAALQHLSPQQRAALVLRDVLSFSADEAAGVLGTSTASVHSALARARRSLTAARLTPADPFDPADPAQQALLADYVRAFESHDVTAMAQLLHNDVQTSMPPFVFWTQGHDRVLALLGSGGCAGARLLAAPKAANATATFGQYRPGPSGLLEPFGLVLVETRASRISAFHTFLFTGHRFGEFGLPEHLPAAP
jgi:RNA polymerase sigma-70 factor (TIGR02960 family)